MKRFLLELMLRLLPQGQGKGKTFPFYFYSDIINLEQNSKYIVKPFRLINKGGITMRDFLKIFSILLAIIITLVIVRIPQNVEAAKSDLPDESQKRLGSAIILYIGSPDAYVNNQKKPVDSTNSEVTPVSISGRSLVPVRFIAENLGAKVEWNEGTSTVTVTTNGILKKTIKMKLGNDKININGKDKAIDTAANKLNDRTFIPFRAMAEAMGKKVFYDRGLIIISDKDNIFNTKTEKTLIDGIIAKVNNLPSIGSEEKLKELLAKFDDGRTGGVIYDLASVENAKTMDTAQGVNNMKAKAETNQSASPEYSKTNVQVEGVDESDIVKTDGKYIYQVNENKVVVAEAYPAENMQVASMIDFTEKKFNPNELYVDDNHLVVIGTTYSDIPIYSTQAKLKAGLMPIRYQRNTVKAIVFDITDKKNIKQEREIELEGSYLSSRKIGSALYLVANKYVYYYQVQNDQDNLTPSYKDSAEGSETKCIGYSQIRYFPGCPNPNYMIVAGIDLNNKDQKANINTYLGSGQNVYASLDNLYVAVTNYSYDTPKVQPQASSIMPRTQNTNTQIYKFSLDKGNVTYLGKGEVPGTILNQYSMDEYNGYFRIATTTGDTWRTDQFTSRNNVYVLSDTLSVVGRLEDIAPGEKIYSTRFMGQRGYMVTFRQVDPLFVIDLTPESPKILGSLKIPGYSDYLHPYDENHIIGFGKDTEETKSGSVLMQGMKMAIFDVSDVSKPKELHKEIIGGRGTDSEILRNPKALLFSKEKNLLAFPVRVVESAGDGYGEKTFQGAYVYNISMDKGFELKAKITHISDEEYAKAGYYGYYSNKNIERLLYIDNTLYSLSKAMFKAHDLNSMKEIKTLEIK